MALALLDTFDFKESASDDLELEALLDLDDLYIPLMIYPLKFFQMTLISDHIHPQHISANFELYA